MKCLTALPIPILKHRILSLREWEQDTKAHQHYLLPRVVTYHCPFHWLDQVGESCSWEKQAFLVSSPAWINFVQYRLYEEPSLLALLKDKNFTEGSFPLLLTLLPGAKKSGGEVWIGVDQEILGSLASGTVQLGG